MHQSAIGQHPRGAIDGDAGNLLGIASHAGEPQQAGRANDRQYGAEHLGSSVEFLSVIRDGLTALILLIQTQLLGLFGIGEMLAHIG
jgi:hypothetical protein